MNDKLINTKQIKINHLLYVKKCHYGQDHLDLHMCQTLNLYKLLLFHLIYFALSIGIAFILLLLVSLQRSIQHYNDKSHPLPEFRIHIAQF